MPILKVTIVGILLPVVIPLGILIFIFRDAAEFSKEFEEWLFRRD